MDKVNTADNFIPLETFWTVDQNVTFLVVANVEKGDVYTKKLDKIVVLVWWILIIPNDGVWLVKFYLVRYV